jgi:hypothetical protein
VSELDAIVISAFSARVEFARRHQRAMRAGLRLAQSARAARAGGASRAPAAAHVPRRALSTKPPPVHPFESFLTGTSSNYIEGMYMAWKQSPASVHVSWQKVFEGVDAGMPPGQTFQPPPSINAGASLEAATVPAPTAFTGAAQPSTDYLKVTQLITAYQARGHCVADLDPLGMFDADLDGSIPPDLELANYGFTEADLDKEFDLGTGGLQLGLMEEGRGLVKLRDLIGRLQQVYTTRIGVEYTHIWNHEQVNWIREMIETPHQEEFTAEEKVSARAHMPARRRLSPRTSRLIPSSAPPCRSACSIVSAGPTTSKRSSPPSTRRRSGLGSRGARRSSSA